jgi:uncharacterized membrane protein YidH (DUF202 family)
MTGDDHIAGGESEQRLRLAEIRTLLAEKRTVFTELQFGFLLVTLPLTIHTGISVLSARHEMAAKLHLLIPFWVFLAIMLVLGTIVTVRSTRSLWRVNRELRQMQAGQVPSRLRC